MSNLSIDIAAAVKSVTKTWKAEKRKADKDDNLYSHQYGRFYQYSDRVTVKEVAVDVMEAAYNHASANGKYYANARQIMYAARPAILKRTGRQEVSKGGKTTYFTQQLLKDYIETYNPPWKIAWDARGHIIEPHTGTMVGLGGIEVTQYMKQWHNDMRSIKIERFVGVSTSGPQNRYKNALFIEKEGFHEILTHAGFPELYDMALMSTKGMPVKAACDLIYNMDLQGVKVFVLHDFDYSGFKIVNTLREGVRLSRGTEVIDLGLRLEDIQGLDTEPVYFKQKKWPGYYLQECGCPPEEVDFLVGGKTWKGKRVELNAMTSEQLITWLHGKLKSYGAEKYVPKGDKLTEGYRHLKKMVHVKEYIEMAEDIWNKVRPPDVPDDLQDTMEDYLRENPRLSWDAAMWNLIAKENDELEQP